MRMTVDETGNDGFSSQVNDPSSGDRVRCHRRFRSDSYDPITGNGNRLGYCEGGIHRDDLAVLENEVGWADNWVGRRAWHFGLSAPGAFLGHMIADRNCTAANCMRALLGVYGR